MSFFQNLRILLKKHYIIHFTTIAFHFTKLFNTFIILFVIFFSFYDSKTSKPHASQAYSSGAMRGLGGFIELYECWELLP